ncbi:MAG: glycosyltransferase, partial [Rickettsiales bacterium]|nr:glycosyltransferase [Rickettsiales bacterium]
MKIFHIIDGRYFEANRKTISELVLSLYEYGVSQEAVTEEGATLGWLSTIVPVKHLKGGEAGRFANKIRMWAHCMKFSPDIVVKWGPWARASAVSGSFVQVSHLSARADIASFDRNDYVMTNLDGPLSYAKENGFSGAKSFMLPAFVKEYKNMPTLSKRDFFVPEKAKIIYSAATFARGIGYETMFDSIGSVQDVYFIIAGAGAAEEYVKDYASRVNVKSRSRFVPEIEKTQSAAAIADFALLPFDEPELAKNILEAMLAGKPVLAADNATAREFIADEKTGFLVPPRDAYLLRRRIREVIA